MRRGFAIVAVLAAVGFGAATAAASFHPGTYSGQASDGGRVLFTTDTQHTTRWQLHGHWIGSSSVSGSICALDSDGTCPTEHLHHYTAELKTAK
jgi:hypothetical protein